MGNFLVGGRGFMGKKGGFAACKGKCEGHKGDLPLVFGDVM